MRIDQFKSELEKVDFYFEYQDSFESSRYRDGKNQFEKVRELANQNEEFKKLFDERDPFRINNN